MAQFLGKQLPPNVVKEIADKCSFDNMREAEDSIKEMHPQVFAYFGEELLDKVKKQGRFKFLRKGNGDIQKYK